MAEEIEALQGCASILEGIDEERHDSRLWTVIAAIEKVVEELEGRE